MEHSEIEKHVRDIVTMLKVQKGKIDFDYIVRWTERLGLAAEWQIIRDRAGGVPNV